MSLHKTQLVDVGSTILDIMLQEAKDEWSDMTIEQRERICDKFNVDYGEANYVNKIVDKRIETIGLWLVEKVKPVVELEYHSRMDIITDDQIFGGWEPCKEK